MLELFIVIVLGSTVGMLLASFIAVAIVMNKKVMAWYMNKVMDLTMNAFDANLAASKEMES